MMTESEWLACEDPSQMLAILESRGCGSNRKFRLFAVGCCRRIWSGLEDGRSRAAVETAERFADGRATQSELRAAFKAASAAVVDCQDFSPFSEDQAIAAFLTAARNINESESKIPESEDANEVASHVWSYATDSDLAGAEKQQPTLLRDITGNPFRPVSIKPNWRTPTVLTLAQSAYDERIMPSGELDPDRLAVLSDALEEAGCDDADILTHLRGLGPHVRGCWAVDLLTGRS